MRVASENLVDKQLFACGVGLAIVTVMLGQLDFQIRVGANKVRVDTQRVPESELLVPSGTVVRQQV
ncbi:Uncharacterised protein [Mycobacteroides abscessus subsp. abscessus]|uniref:Uncharacterized protein n=1 Tax=Mycobacteroides abscessus (strain ATCC 19977 / DSM 44196 / CCUG 20993 / CIP 104536 / JCM 13569 / NCTC 13031 / TMC 1543 / L948) TaxID=561007 RepID=B1MMB8_MYCA9|nr:Hypothetical protein MAB_4835 [Mycobacteroides abscessus ATCC 19977]SHZ88118.1 Uncharacterised protein [Mycobacteroides abscessus subsp. abscessus]SIG22386.1 Uncharacterised protein [Mycobacteroides abscessus subsp. abscessus]